MMALVLQDFFTQLHNQRERSREYMTLTYNKFIHPVPSSSIQSMFLIQLTKKELDAIRRWIGVEGVSKLTKQPLIERLVTEVPTAIERFILTMDNERLSLLKKLQKGDRISTDTLTPHKLVYFTHTSLAFTVTEHDQTYLIMPEDVRTLLNNYDQSDWQIQADINDAVIRLTQGLVYYYGYMPKSTVFELVSPIVSFDLVRLDAIIKDAKNYYDYLKETEQDLMDSRVVDLDMLKSEQKKSIYEKHFSFTDNQLIEAGAEDFMDLTDELIQLIKHLKERYLLDDEAMNRYMDDTLILLNSFIDVDPSFLFLSKHLHVSTDEDKKMLLALLQAAQDSIHTWALKGNKRKKTHVQAPVSIKVGRNDPCPCGSGKKHKKCCGK